MNAAAARRAVCEKYGSSHVRAMLLMVDRYLGLQVGYKFIVDDQGYEDVWYDPSAFERAGQALGLAPTVPNATTTIYTMFSSLKRLLDKAGTSNTQSVMSTRRLQALADAYGEAEHIDRDPDRAAPIDIHAYGRNFVEECDTEAGDDEGYVLVTCGMSDCAMSLPVDCEEPPCIELVWYVRDLNPAYFGTLRWLAQLPRIDQTWFGHGHTVPMPGPPLPFCAFQTFLLLPPIIRTDRELLEGLPQPAGQSLGTLAVHLISQAEYALVKTDDGLDQFLDLLDVHGYPFVFDPARRSML